MTKEELMSQTLEQILERINWLEERNDLNTELIIRLRGEIETLASPPED